jgi:hypothetical protein
MLFINVPILHLIPDTNMAKLSNTLVGICWEPRPKVLNANLTEMELFVTPMPISLADNRDINIASDDKSTSRSRTGYLIKYAGMPITWASRLQTEGAHSSTESDYISTALRNAIPMIDFLQELVSAGFKFITKGSTIQCTAFEDNEGALEMARSPKFCPQTKHINIKYHHFHNSIKSGKVSMQGIDTKEQQADILTKPLEVSLFTYIRSLIMGW